MATYNDVTSTTDRMHSSSEITLSTEESFYDQLTEAELAEIHRYRSIRMILVVVFIGSYVCITTMCNAVALLILFQRAFVKNAFAIGQRVLAILDILLAVTVLLKYSVKGNTDLDITTMNKSVCRVYKTFYFTVVATVNWTIVYLTAVRFISLKYPLKVNTHSFVQRAYLSLIITSCMVSLFYTLIYHEVIRALDADEYKASAGECFSYADIPLNGYILRTTIVSMETILPAIAIAVVNTLTYREYRSVSIRRGQLKEAVFSHTQTILEMKSAVAEREREATASVDNPESPKKATPRTSLRDDTKHTTNGTLADRPTIRASYTVPTTGNPESQIKWSTFSEAGSHQEKRSFRDQIKTFKHALRRNTVAYGLLYNTENTPILIQQRRRISSKTNLNRQQKHWGSSILTSSSSDSKISKIRFYDTMKLTNINCLIILTTAAFFIQNSPYCIWYIIGELDRNARSTLIDEIMFIIHCFGHILDAPLYIFSSSKVQTEGSKLLRHFRRCTLGIRDL